MAQSGNTSLCLFLHTSNTGVTAMGLLAGGLLVLSVWCPASLLQLIHQAAGIIGGKQ